MACRKGGRVSVPGVYGGFLDKFPLGALMEKGLQLRTGQTHVQRFTRGPAAADRGGRDRHHLPDQPPAAAGGGARGLPQLPRQSERVDEGGPQARALGGRRMSKGLAVVTGASSGIGLELARCCAEDGYELLICSDDRRDRGSRRARCAPTARRWKRSRPTSPPRRASSGSWRRSASARWTCCSPTPGSGSATPSSTRIWTGRLRRRRSQRHRHDRADPPVGPPDAGAGRGPHPRSPARSPASCRGASRRSTTAPRRSSTASAIALRNELKDTGVTVTCLMPGADRHRLLRAAPICSTPRSARTRQGRPADVARQGYGAMMKGDSGVVTGFMNKVQTAFSGIIPDTVLAQMHRRMAEPGKRRQHL